MNGRNRPTWMLLRNQGLHFLAAAPLEELKQLGFGGYVRNQRAFNDGCAVPLFAKLHDRLMVDPLRRRRVGDHVGGAGFSNRPARGFVGGPITRGVVPHDAAVGCEQLNVDGRSGLAGIFPGDVLTFDLYRERCITGKLGDAARRAEY